MSWARGWWPLLLAPAGVLAFAPSTWPRWATMWTLAVAIYVGCKWLTWRRTAVDAPLWRHLGYLLAWPGLDAAAFLTLAPRNLPTAGEWIFGVTKLAVGLVFFFVVAKRAAPLGSYAVGWAGMTGLVFMLHFGTFHLLSCAWRRAGVEARPLMNWPIGSVSLREFWGRRWNTAFRDLTHRFLFRPFTARLGPGGAVAAGFVFSGIVHDVVISFPAGGGYGGPTFFFSLQAIAMLAERSAAGRRAGLGRGAIGWLFTLLVLTLPAAALFHVPFVENIVIPFMRSAGAL